MAGTRKKMGHFTLLAVLLASMLAGCSKNNETPSASGSSSAAPTKAVATESASATSSASEPAIDTSKEVNLKGYLIGEAPKGLPEVVTELNSRLKQDINATLEIDYVGYSDMSTKYPLILTNSGGTDWIYSANWLNYVQHASKGAFMELTEEMIKKYMPTYYESIDKEAFKAASVNGKLYMVPAPARSPSIPVAVIRGDLRKKYGIAEIKRLSDLAPYFEAIKKNEPDMIPAALSSNASDLTMMYSLMADQGQAPIQLINGYGLAYFMEDPTAKLMAFDEEPLKSKLLQAAGTMKEWYDAGYINRNYFSNKVNSLDAFDQGKSSIGFANTISVRRYLDTGKEKGYDIELIPLVDGEGKTMAPEWTSGGISIPAGAKNPERTLMAMDRIISHQDYNYLVYFGIEGKNYVLNSEGKLELPPGVTSKTNTYPPDAAGFWFTDLRQFPAYASWSDQYIQLLKDIQDHMLYDGPLTGMNFNFESLKAEVAALTTVRTQYLLPLTMGSVKDVNEALNTFMEKAKVAGFQKIRDEAQKQIDAYVQTKSSK
ncbi:putative aldouronate transport system substrate-binding protein [Cohnella sp. OV330]|uniref:extracellular solute-binding protein n=1 Tax=Cohnella sp. OV330 TaxID=1855288 RepID=UPI0008EBFB1E|nr:extracellular solute-binding protein [Cohnella sp. OV330]SFB56403.1 putative aldouronate transport system substrate-binding protein [Cohnella sp. OV330]